MADEANAVNEEGRAKALKFYKILGGVLLVLGAGMLACGIIAANNIDEESFGPPYFVGGFTVGILGLFSALVCGIIILKAPGATTQVKKQELGCAIQGHYMLSMFMLMGCFIGTFLAGIGGFTFSSEMSTINKNLAVVILLGCILGLIITIASFCIFCTYSRFFGVIMRRGYRGRTVIINTHNPASASTDPNIFLTSNGQSAANNAQISQLERQNQLLQQQLELQKQLNQQQQFGGGFSQPPPPPMYDSSSAYPPSAPPKYS